MVISSAMQRQRMLITAIRETDTQTFNSSCIRPISVFLEQIKGSIASENVRGKEMAEFEAKVREEYARKVQDFLEMQRKVWDSKEKHGYGHHTDHHSQPPITKIETAHPQATRATNLWVLLHDMRVGTGQVLHMPGYNCK